jgi:hypothetical protein
VPFIPSVFLLRVKITLRCGALGTTYWIRAKHFLCTNCVKYTTPHRPHTTNHTSTFNSRRRLSHTDHTLKIKQFNAFSAVLQQASWLLIKYNVIIGHMQHIALLSILYVCFAQWSVVLRVYHRSRYYLSKVLMQSLRFERCCFPPVSMIAIANFSPLTLPRDSIHPTKDKAVIIFKYCSLSRSVRSIQIVSPFAFWLCAMFSHIRARPKFLSLYGCKTWCLTLSEERSLMVFKNRVLRSIFGSKKDEVTWVEKATWWGIVILPVMTTVNISLFF